MWYELVRHLHEQGPPRGVLVNCMRRHVAKCGITSRFRVGRILPGNRYGNVSPQAVCVGWASPGEVGRTISHV